MAKLMTLQKSTRTRNLLHSKKIQGIRLKIRLLERFDGFKREYKSLIVFKFILIENFLFSDMILKYFIDKTTLNYSGSQVKHIKTQKVLKKQY